MKLYLLSIYDSDGCTYSQDITIGVFKSEGHAKQASVQHCNHHKNQVPRTHYAPIEDYQIKEIELGVLFG